ncbi:MAG: hypothetical protein DWQ05_15675 [Calditrichaeota bacterium]|nr:MAG: hypothetical protein DWQ05_15675 [Calditrichota bacterium]
MGVWVSLFLFSCANSVKNELSQAVASLTILENSDAINYVKEELRGIRSLVEKTQSQLKLNEKAQAASNAELVMAQIQDVAVIYQKRKKGARKKSQSILDKMDARIASFATELKSFPSKTYVDQNRHDEIRYKLRKAQAKLDDLRLLYKDAQYNKIADKQASIVRLLAQVETVFIDHEKHLLAETEKKPEIMAVSNDEVDYTESENISLTPGME